jgi:hypothetical protein
MQSNSRGGATVRVACVHTTEGVLTVAALREFFNRPGATGSSHAGADADGVLAEGADGGFVPYDQAAWTLRNGNPWSDNLELCGFAAWTRAQWLARPKLLEACAQWLAGRNRARGIPLVKLTVDQLRAQMRGVIDHDDYTDATGDGTHWDVGESFPWDVVMPRAVQLAGSAPGVTLTNRRRRTMWMTSDETQTVYLVDSTGLRVLFTMEEVNCVGWLLNEARAADAVLHFNRRFHDVLIAVLGRTPVRTRVTMPAPVRDTVARVDSQRLDPEDLLQLTGYATEEEPWGPPAPIDAHDSDAIGPPPGFVPGVDPYAPGH